MSRSSWNPILDQCADRNGALYGGGKGADVLEERLAVMAEDNFLLPYREKLMVISRGLVPDTRSASYGGMPYDGVPFSSLFKITEKLRVSPPAQVVVKSGS